LVYYKNKEKTDERYHGLVGKYYHNPSYDGLWGNLCLRCSLWKKKNWPPCVVATVAVCELLMMKTRGVCY